MTAFPEQLKAAGDSMASLGRHKVIESKAYPAAQMNTDPILSL